MIGIHHPVRVWNPRFIGKFKTVDDIAAIAWQGFAINCFTIL